ncbi:MAG: S41 family peptidase [Pseudomonadota bacterium]
MIRKLSFLFAGAVMGATAVTLVSGTAGFGVQAKAASSETFRQLNIFGDIFERVRANYVEEPGESDMVEAAIKGMLTSLDPHSGYLNKREFSDMQTQTRGQFGGLGIEVTLDQDTELVKVITPMDDTPASRAGVLPNDLIFEIDGEPTRGLTLREAVDLMRGNVGSDIDLTLVREGADGPIDVTLTREVIKLQAVRSRVEGEDIGYIKITSFTGQTFDGLTRAIEKINNDLGKENVKGYVLDLRLNPGGLVDQAVSVSDAFLDRGEIVSLRGRDPQQNKRFNARPGDMVDGKPVIVLINGGSASASEIVAGALQDLKRATVVGSRSFGKGSVQTIIPLAGNGALRLTTALYYTPSGKSIQAKGISPDITVAQPLPEDLQGRRSFERSEADLRGHIEVGEDEETKDETVAEDADQDAPAEDETAISSYVPADPKDDVQLAFAMQLLRGEKTDPNFPPNENTPVPN